MFRPNHQRGLGGFAGDAAAVLPGIGAERHGGGGQRRVTPKGIHHRHPVLGQRARLVGADDLGAAQCLHGGEPTDDGLPPGHIGDADGQHHRDHGGEALGDGGHRQGHRRHKGIQNDPEGKSPGPEDLHGEDEGADGQHQPGEGAGELAQFSLEGGLSLLRVGKGVGDLAHLGIHPRGGKDGFAPAIDHHGTHVDHVFPIPQGDIRGSLGQGDGVGGLADGEGLTGEGGLLGFQTGTFDEPPVGGDGVPGLQQYHVPHRQILAADGADLAAPQYPGGGGGHLLQSLDGPFRLVLLVDPQHRVDDHHRQDDDHIGKTLPLHRRQYAADGGGRQQDEDHRVGQLAEEADGEGNAGGRRQFVFAVGRQPRGGLLPGQTGG